MTSTTVKSFIDTNILIYALDQADPAKQQKARALLKTLQEKESGVISTQVLQEFYVVSTAKLKLNVALVKKIIVTLKYLKTITVDLKIIKEAIDCSALNKISFWDALVVTTAKSSGCHSIWSEDLGHGQQISGVRIINPFKEPAE
jgi:predicted nucleic acid-binding protein